MNIPPRDPWNGDFRVRNSETNTNRIMVDAPNGVAIWIDYVDGHVVVTDGSANATMNVRLGALAVTFKPFSQKS